MLDGALGMAFDLINATLSMSVLGIPPAHDDRTYPRQARAGTTAMVMVGTLPMLPSAYSIRQALGP